jgi:hypothetical protein
MRHSQRGVTLIGWLFLIIPLAIVGYAAIRLIPFYLNYFRVSQAMTQVAAQAAGGDASTGVSMRNSLEKRFDIESIERPAGKDIDIHREGDHWVAIVDYEELAPLFGNISLLVQFHKQVDAH